MLEMSQVSYSDGESAVVDRLDAAFDPGTMTIILGPVGSGTMTTLRILTGELTPTGGFVRFAGRIVAGSELGKHVKMPAPAAKRRRIGCGITAHEVVSQERCGHTVPDANDRAAIYHAIDVVDARDLANCAYDTLSGCDALKIDVAAILAQNVRHIVFTEPKSALDADQHYDVLSLYHRLTLHGATVIAALHDLNAAMLLADRVILMHSGQIVADGLPQIVLERGLVRTMFAAAAPARTRDAAPHRTEPARQPAHAYEDAIWRTSRT